jgi:hypothetical protein
MAYVLCFCAFSTLDLNCDLLDDRDVQRGDFSKALISWFVSSLFVCCLLPAALILFYKVFHVGTRDCPQSRLSTQFRARVLFLCHL